MVRRSLVGFVVVGIVVGVAVGLGGPTRVARATTFVAMDETQLAQASSVSVLGTVVDIVSGRDSAGGRIYTDISIEVERVLLGEVQSDLVVIREVGGRHAGDEEWVYGAPQYRLGERVVVYLVSRDDGTFRTTAMSLGKFRVLSEEAGGSLHVARHLGEGARLLDPSTGRVRAGAEPEILELRGARRERRRRGSAIVDLPPPEPLVAVETRSEFTHLGSAPTRWFEPDSGESVKFGVDPTGDPGPELGPENSVGAIEDAFDAWSSVSGSELVLEAGDPLSEPVAFGGCSGSNRIVFNDPFDEITDPAGCSGVLAVGGYCSSSETRAVNGTTFRRIRLGKVTFNNGWSDCWGWNRCNLSEVATHEIGHALGLGHSLVPNAVMRAYAYFNGRCAALGEDDEAAMRFMYPSGSQVTATPTATSVPPTPTHSHTPTPFPTATPTNTPTPVPTDTPTPVPTDTPTPVPTDTPTDTPTFTPSPTRTPTLASADLSGRVRYFMGGGSVPLVEMAASGGVAPQLTTTDDAGRFQLSLLHGSVTLTGRKSGDLRDAVSSLDAAWALQAVVGARELTEYQRIACDVTGDGNVTPLDASRLLQLSVGAIERLPVAERCGGDWMILPKETPGAAMIPPTIDLAECSHGALSISELAADWNGVDFEAVLFGDCSGSWQASSNQLRPRPRSRRARISLGHLDVDGASAALPVYLRSPRAHRALDIELRYDESRLRPIGVETRDPNRNASSAMRVVRPGLLRVALASAEPARRSRRRPFLYVLFEVEAAVPSRGAVSALHARVDEEVVRVHARR